MSIVNPSILPGFMELTPDKQKAFDTMKEIIEKNFKKYGFINIDTPTIEKEEILLSKGGGETSKQIYRIDKESTPQALRFDLTVSLARYVAMRANDLSFPFKRYQIGKVYRGERNQKGRYREFYQCDIDVVGNEKLSVVNDAQLPSVIFNIFKDFGFEDLVFRVNNRKLLGGFLESIGVDAFEEVLRSIDKLEKIGVEKTKSELENFGISNENIDKIFEFIEIEGSNDMVLESLGQLEIENENFVKGLEEINLLYRYMRAFLIPDKNIKIDLTITRGLDYYTGNVFETFLVGYENIGSVCSGGRYESLANNFTKNMYPGVGLSIGLTRLFYQLDEANLLQNLNIVEDDKVLVLPVEMDMFDYAIEIANILRTSDIDTDIYLEDTKVKKKFAYADKSKAKYVIIIGKDERENNKVSVKNFQTGEQVTLDKAEILTYFNGGK